MTVRCAIVGAGLIGSRRAAIAANSPRCEVVAVVDVDGARAREVATDHGCAHTTDWREVVADAQVDAIDVCTPNKFLAPVTVAALEAGKHVLCEKPLGRHADEAASMLAAARAYHRVLKVGFTLRFHPALRQARTLCEQGEIGPPFLVRAVYGHGGRPGYDREWRGDADLAGGGELLDQGVHLLDLSRWFLGDFSEVTGLTPRWFWDIAPLEDNAFVWLRTPDGRLASLHTSWTQWRNRFSFEVYGRDGYVQVDGLGGSYGVETLTIGRRLPESGPPTEERVVFDGPDCSWEDDWNDFLDAIELGTRPAADGEDGLAVMRLVDAIYAGARGRGSGIGSRPLAPGPRPPQ
jgi:predicted dehydrogenase